MKERSKDWLDNFLAVFICIVILGGIIAAVAGVYRHTQEKLEIIDKKSAYIYMDRGKHYGDVEELKEILSYRTFKRQGIQYAFLMGGKTYTVTKEDYDKYSEGDFIRIKGTIFQSDGTDTRVLGEYVPTKDR